MTARCKHITIRIEEEAKALTVHNFEGGCWTHDSNFAEYTGVIYVACRECGYRARYTQATLPKWLIARLDEAARS
jgi:hypothetical protein